MKVIKLKEYMGLFFGTAIVLTTSFVYFFKKNISHNKYGPATIYRHSNYAMWWCYKGISYGANEDFTIKTWKKKFKELKQQDKLKIFK